MKAPLPDRVAIKDLTSVSAGSLALKGTGVAAAAAISMLLAPAVSGTAYADEAISNNQSVDQANTSSIPALGSAIDTPTSFSDITTSQTPTIYIETTPNTVDLSNEVVAPSTPAETAFQSEIIISDQTASNLAKTEPPVAAAVAKIGNNSFYTIEEAFGTVQTNETITLLSDITTENEISCSKSMTLDGGGFQFNSNKGFVFKGGSNAPIDITFRNITIKGQPTHDVSSGYVTTENCSFTLDNASIVFQGDALTIDDHYSVFESKESSLNVTIQNDSKVIIENMNPGNVAFLTGINGTLYIKGNSLLDISAVADVMTSGSLIVDNSIVKLSKADDAPHCDKLEILNNSKVYVSESSGNALEAHSLLVKNSYLEVNDNKGTGIRAKELIFDDGAVVLCKGNSSASSESSAAVFLADLPMAAATENRCIIKPGAKVDIVDNYQTGLRLDATNLEILSKNLRITGNGINADQNQKNGGGIHLKNSTNSQTRAFIIDGAVVRDNHPNGIGDDVFVEGNVSFFLVGAANNHLFNNNPSYSANNTTWQDKPIESRSNAPSGWNTQSEWNAYAIADSDNNEKATPSAYTFAHPSSFGAPHIEETDSDTSDSKGPHPALALTAVALIPALMITRRNHGASSNTPRKSTVGGSGKTSGGISSSSNSSNKIARNAAVAGSVGKAATKTASKSSANRTANNTPVKSSAKGSPATRTVNSAPVKSSANSAPVKSSANSAPVKSSASRNTATTVSNTPVSSSINEAATKSTSTASCVSSTSGTSGQGRLIWYYNPSNPNSGRWIYQNCSNIPASSSFASKAFNPQSMKVGSFKLIPKNTVGLMNMTDHSMAATAIPIAAVAIGAASLVTLNTLGKKRQTKK